MFKIENRFRVIECRHFPASRAAEPGWGVGRVPESYLYGLTSFCFKWIIIAADAFIQIQL